MKIQFIVNPAAGAEEPILSYLNTAFDGTGIDWDVSVTQQSGDAARLAAAFGGNVDAIGVYGGDGSVTEVVQGLGGQKTPIAIIPGGTANVLAKELGLPIDSREVLAMLASGRYSVRSMDAGQANGELFLIRVNFGLMAEMITEADCGMKDRLGQLAYGVAAMKSFLKAEQKPYRMDIDGVVRSVSAVAMTITNCGSIGIGGLHFIPGIAHDDGVLDLLVLEEAGLLSALRLTGSTLAQKDSDVLRHWKAREIHLEFDGEETYLLDDGERKASRIDIVTLPGAVRVLIPKP